MIFITSSSIKAHKISESVRVLAEHGFKAIELSGGTDFYPEYLEDLKSLQDKFNLSLRCHNYFPPPKKHFVLNLASMNDDIWRASVEHVKEALRVSRAISSHKYGIHAGFFIDIAVNEIGKRISHDKLAQREKAYERFCNSFRELNDLARSMGIALYLENNVFSSTNFKTFNGENFFMLTNSYEYKELKQKIDFKLLLDVAHLKVSCKSLGLNFESELEKLSNETDYFHLSDNDSFHDQNKTLLKDSELLKSLKRHHLFKGDLTLEIYDSIESIQSALSVIEDLKND